MAVLKKYTDSMHIPEIRYRSPYWQCFMMGLCVGFSAGIYGAVNLLGAGGGRPDSAQVVQIVNATLCGVWFFSACFGGSVLNLLGPALTMSIGILTYIVYLGSLWYFDEVGKRGYPIASGVIIGIGAGFIYITAGYINLAYPEEKEKGLYTTTTLNLQYFGFAVGGLIPLIINRNTLEAGAGSPRAVYIALIIVMFVAAIVALFLLPPQKLRRDDGSIVAVDPPRSAWVELKSNLLVFTDWKLMIMVPCFLPSECYLVYAGSVNAFHNSLRARSLLSFLAVTVQIPCGLGLQWILDNPRWSRRKRTLKGLFIVSVFLIGAWVWEIIRVRNYNRHDPAKTPLDWNEPGFGPICILFLLTWISSSLWQYITLYYLGALTNAPVKSAHYAGVFRGFLGAGEAICFGLDSIEVPYIKEAGTIFAFYIAGIVAFAYLGWYHIEETNYFKEEDDGVVVPNHILRETGREIGMAEELPNTENKDPSEVEKTVVQDQ